ncbi:histidine--tRNA ligase [Orientia chuto str. Dubai]|uniref:Histidine--tRNA ligase n=1 Tax=Orientia chuto str. Dubai TaxID=1359168 RepID=A0A0F3MN73_9RICK|nr:histidine--tRNA ligase [Candidatus Orientia mediorientalis]KJV57096.1 histidine--tRNA ligase [Orientia chuto str. Dubai]
MLVKLQPVKGSKDLLPEEFHKHDYIISISRKLSKLYGFQPIATPIIEYTEVFSRTLGKDSDVLSKEMYTFLDKSSRSISLRPEFTAGIMRAVIHNNLQYQKIPLKYFSSGPAFRYDNPQAGRQRQFHQINLECIGDSSPFSDVELILLAQDIFKALNLINRVNLEINSLGCIESRSKYQQALVEYFSKYRTELSIDSQRRLIENPLRILDSKNLHDQKISASAPNIYDYYTIDAKNYFNKVLEYLEFCGIKYSINTNLVRGLDYYCHTVFEYVLTEVGTQSSVLGGGRYDGLFEQMGGKWVKKTLPAVGFAAGIERLALLTNYNLVNTRPIVIIPINEENNQHAIMLLQKLRNNNIVTVIDLQGNVSKRLNQANSINARKVIFIGSTEIHKQNYKIKDLDTSEECVIMHNEILNYLQNN